MNRAVFLDRDGVINQPITRDGFPYAPTSLAEFVLIPGVKEACRHLKEAGFLLVVATNQPDVGRGELDQAVVESIHAHMRAELPIDQVEVCYDSGRGKEPSPDRKPAPGMLLRAARDLSIDLSRSFMVGDRWRDVDCGHAAGCTTVWIDYGYTEKLRQQPDYTVHNLTDAIEVILRHASEK